MDDAGDAVKGAAGDGSEKPVDVPVQVRPKFAAFNGEGTDAGILSALQGALNTIPGTESGIDFDMSSLPRWAWLNADAVAAAGWRDLNRGKAVSVPGVLYKALRLVLRFAR